MTRTELHNLLLYEWKWGSGMGQVQTIYLSRNYALLSRQDLDNMVPAYRNNAQLLGVDNYTPGRWACTGFSLLALTQAKLQNFKSTQEPVGVAFGFVGYLSQWLSPGQMRFPPEEDAINFAIVLGDQGPEPVFWQPQLAARGTSPVIDLAPEEIESISGIII